MHEITKAAVAISRVLARLHRWRWTAVVLIRVPLQRLDRYSVGRLLYALSMVQRDDPAAACALLDALLKRNAQVDAELRIELAAMANATGHAERATVLLQQAERTATTPHTAEVAQRLHSVQRGAEGGSLAQEIASLITGLHLDPSEELVILVPVSSLYLDLWKLWHEQVTRHVGGRVVAMAMNDAACDALQNIKGVSVLDVRGYFAWNAEGRLHHHLLGVLWYLRVLVLRALVQQGHTVLVLDLDAVPVGDLASLLQRLPAADVIAQQDHSIPMDVERQFGFVLCCGCMLWRPTAAACALLDRFAAESARERNDQHALNHLLQADGIVRKQITPQYLRFGSAGVEFVCPHPSLVSRSLHSGSVVRHFHQKGQSVGDLRSALGLTNDREH